MRRCGEYEALVSWNFVHIQVTYMLEGSFSHEDFCGHKGTINPGDLQVHALRVFLFLCVCFTVKLVFYHTHSDSG